MLRPLLAPFLTATLFATCSGGVDPNAGAGGSGGEPWGGSGASTAGLGGAGGANGAEASVDAVGLEGTPYGSTSPGG